MHICHYNCIWLCQLNGLSNLGPIFLMKHKFRQLGVSTNQVPCNFLLLQSQPVVPWSQKGCHISRHCICTRNRRNERKRNRNSMPADIIYQEITDFLKYYHMDFHLHFICQVQFMWLLKTVKEPEKLSFYSQMHYCPKLNWNLI